MFVAELVLIEVAWPGSGSGVVESTSESSNYSGNVFGDSNRLSESCSIMISIFVLLCEIDDRAEIFVLSS